MEQCDDVGPKSPVPCRNDGAVVRNSIMRKTKPGSEDFLFASYINSVDLEKKDAMPSQSLTRALRNISQQGDAYGRTVTP